MLLRGSDEDLDQVLSVQRDADAGALRRVGLVHPLVPGAIHLGLATHIGDVDRGAQDARLVRADLGQCAVDGRQRITRLFVEGWRLRRRGVDRIYEVAMRHRATAGCRSA